MPSGPDTQAGGGDREAFEILDLLGVGAFATTYKARILAPELWNEYGYEIVALKVPHAHLRRAIHKEIRLNTVLLDRLRKLESKHLVRYLGFEVFRGGISMVMEYVPTGSLRGLLGAIGSAAPMRPRQVFHVAEGVLRGLVSIHAAGAVHRDLKPDNVLLDGTNPKIADLGVSQILSTGELRHTVAGTILYMAPEILRGDGGSFPADIWSLGVMMYEMATGVFPFGGPDVAVGVAIDQIREAKPVPVTQRVPDTPRALGDLIAVALDKDPARRLTAEQFLEILLGVRERATSPEASVVAPALVTTAITLISQQKPIEALALTQQARSLDPQLCTAWNAEGVILSDLGRHEESIQCLRTATEIRPQWANAWNNWGRTLRAAGRSREALACYERAAELEPHDAIPWANKGNCLRTLGRLPEAIAAYDRALALSPNLADIWCGRGQALQDLGRAAEALSSLQRAVDLRPQDREVLTAYRGVVEGMARRADAAGEKAEARELRTRLDSVGEDPPP